MKISQLLNEVNIPRVEDVYYPLDDTYMVLEYFDTPEFHDTLSKFNNQERISILDMGCGTGILGYCAMYLAQTIGNFTDIQLSFIDINPLAIETTKRMIKDNSQFITNSNLQCFQSDLFDKIAPQQYDLILFNPPYLPQDDEIRTHRPIDHALYGGTDGISVLTRFFDQVNNYIDSNSVIYFIASSLGALDQLILDLSPKYRIEKIQNVHIFFEDITLFHAQKKL